MTISRSYPALWPGISDKPLRTWSFFSVIPLYIFLGSISDCLFHVSTELYGYSIWNTFRNQISRSYPAISRSYPALWPGINYNLCKNMIIFFCNSFMYVSWQYIWVIIACFCWIIWRQYMKYLQKSNIPFLSSHIPFLSSPLTRNK